MLRLENIKKSFNIGTTDMTTLFDDFNLNVKKGEFVSIIGSNGSGKTTLLNLISGSLPIDNGNIILDGKSINKQVDYVRARKIGRVFQDPSKGVACNMTIAENFAIAENKNKPYGLTFGLKPKKIEYYRDIVADLKLGLENKMNVPVGSLSGGQRQALSLILATLTPLDLLLLDEHTAALDPKISQQIMEVTKKIVQEKGLTTLMVTHNLKFAVDYGTRLLMMDKGQVIMDKQGQEKQNLVVNDILDVFNSISIESGN